MADSYRKHNILGFTTAESEKEDKQIANRKLRRKANQVSGQAKFSEDGDDVSYPDMKEVADNWCFAKDGKQIVSDSDITNTDFFNGKYKYVKGKPKLCK